MAINVAGSANLNFLDLPLIFERKKPRLLTWAIFLFGFGATAFFAVLTAGGGFLLGSDHSELDRADVAAGAVLPVAG